MTRFKKPIYMRKNNSENKYLYLAYILFLLLIGSCSTSRKMSMKPQELPGIDIMFTGGEAPDSVWVRVAPLPTDTCMFEKEYYEAIDFGRRDAYAVKDGAVHISPDSVPSEYRIVCDNYLLTSCRMRSSEHIDLTVGDFSKRDYTLTGGIYSFDIPHYQEFLKLKPKLFSLSRHKLTEEELDSLTDEMHLLIDKIMAESHPEAATRVAVLLDEDFVPYAYDRLPVGSENTLYYTNIRARRNSAMRSAEQESMINASLETSAPVPEITLNSLDGQTFNVSELRGKWVMLDFWVSWCGPCRRGFDKMKKLYSDYSDRLEIVGISCGDQTDTWQSLVKELELPWRNLLAPSPGAHDGMVAGFPVPAYPTKVIIDPEGRLCDFTVGETEDFYSRLENMVK